MLEVARHGNAWDRKAEFMIREGAANPLFQAIDRSERDIRGTYFLFFPIFLLQPIETTDMP